VDQQAQEELLVHAVLADLEALAAAAAGAVAPGVCLIMEKAKGRRIRAALAAEVEQVHL
jgi:hypothetical protein